MKKLLSILGAVSITASGTVTVIACSGTTASDNEHQKIVSSLLSQYSKALYVSQKGVNGVHVSPTDIFTEIFGSQDPKDLGIKTDEKLFSELINKNFDMTNLINNTVPTGEVYTGKTTSLISPVSGMGSTVINFLPTILDVIKDPTKLTEALPLISQFLNAETISGIVSALPPENAKILTNAFSEDIYKGMDYNKAINSSVIGLANAVEYLTNSNPKILSYASATDVSKNFTPAVDILATKITGLVSGKASIQASTTNLVAGVGEIIRFVRTLLVYLNSFSETEMTQSVLTKDKIKAKRLAVVSNNSVDLKKIIKIIKYMVSNDDNGIVIKNIFGVMLGTTIDSLPMDSLIGLGVSKDMEIAEKSEGGYMSILVGAAVKSFKSKTIEFPLSGNNIKVYYSHLLRGLINFLTFSSNTGGVKFVLPMLYDFKDNLPEPFKGIMKNFDEEEWKVLAKDPLKYLWSNDNTKLNFSLKEALNKPLSELMDLFSVFQGKTTPKFDDKSSAWSDMFLDKSVADIVDKLDKGLAKHSTAVINFSDIKNFVVKFTDAETLKKISADPTKTMELLGIKDNKFVEGSALEALKKALDGMPWMDDLIKVVINFISEHDKKIIKYKSLVSEFLEKLKVDVISKADKKYTFNVVEGTEKHSYTFELSGEAGKLVIDGINYQKSK